MQAQAWEERRLEHLLSTFPTARRPGDRPGRMPRACLWPLLGSLAPKRQSLAGRLLNQPRRAPSALIPAPQASLTPMPWR